MTEQEFEKRREIAILNQAILISQWKTTECYDLIRNTLLALEKSFKLKKQRLLETPSVSVKEVMIYYSGLEDCVGKIFEEIDKIIANGEAVKNKNEILAKYED